MRASCVSPWSKFFVMSVADEIDLNRLNGTHATPWLSPPPYVGGYKPLVAAEVTRRIIQPSMSVLPRFLQPPWSRFVPFSKFPSGSWAYPTSVFQPVHDDSAMAG